MNKIHYIFRTLCASRASTAIKVLSLGLGLTMCSFLFARVAHDNSIDSGFGDTDRLYQLWMQFTLDGKQLDKQQMCVYPLAGACAEELDDILESGTVLRGIGDITFVEGNHKLKGTTIMVDSTFFATMGVSILQGNANALVSPGSIFLSDVAAREMFGDEDPVGKVLSPEEGSLNLTVRGVFKSWGEETTIPADYIISVHDAGWNIGAYWNGGDSWYSYIRLKEKPKNPEELDKRITALIERHSPSTESMSLAGFAAPIRDTYRNQDEVRQMTLTLSILGFAILFICALNYVLLSISSLSQRAKSIGVHKCSGANGSTIFGMFLIETAMIILAAIAVGVFFWWLVIRFAHESVYDNFAAYLSMDRMWVVIAVVVLVFIIAGLIPAKVFSNIPVSHVFRRFSEKKLGWKYALLFVEFAGVALVAGMLVLVSAQYKCLTDTNPGFDEEHIAVMNNPADSVQEQAVVLDALTNLPYVERVTTSNGFPGYGYSGEFIRDNTGKVLFSTRFDNIGKDYTDVMGMKFVAGGPGHDTPQDYECIINEEFVELMGWKNDDAVGRYIDFSGKKVLVTGVIRNFSTGTYYQEQQPYSGHKSTDRWMRYINLKLAEPFDKSLHQLSDTIAAMFPAEKYMNVFSIKDSRIEHYSEIKLFQTLVSMASVILLLICGIGLTGYLSDEMRRRSREIAVRKVNGATTTSVVELICKSVLYLALPAVIVGTLAAWYLGKNWLEQFAVTIENAGAYFAFSGLVTLIIIMIIAILLTVRRASVNPVENLRSE